MRYSASVVASALLLSVGSTSAFAPSKQTSRHSLVELQSAVEEATETTKAVSTNSNLTYDDISRLRFREVKRELEYRQLDASGTHSALKYRLRVAELCIETEVPESVIRGELLNDVSA
jgi:hypothetical protein